MLFPQTESECRCLTLFTQFGDEGQRKAVEPGPEWRLRIQLSQQNPTFPLNAQVSYSLTENRNILEKYIQYVIRFIY